MSVGYGSDTVEPRQDLVIAFDIPVEASADEAASRMNALCPEDSYVHATVVWPGVGVRVFCKRSKSNAPKQLAVKTAEDARADGALLQIITASPGVTVETARVKLQRLGFRRGADWVKEAIAVAKSTKRDLL